MADSTKQPDEQNTEGGFQYEKIIRDSNDFHFWPRNFSRGLSFREAHTSPDGIHPAYHHDENGEVVGGPDDCPRMI